MKNLFGHILLIILLLSLKTQAGEQLSFTTFTVEEGLSDNTIYSIFQDRQGFIWIATYNGLNKFDGYNFTVYRPEAYNKKSVSEGVTTMFQSSNGTLWIGSQSVLQYYDAQKDNFVSFPFLNKYNSKINIHITAITEDSEGILWLGTYNYGLLKFNPKTSKFANIADSATMRKYPFPSRKISCMLLQNKHLWIGTEDVGLIRFNIDKKSYTIYSYTKNDNNSLASNHIRSITWDKYRKRIWIGSENGINYIDEDKKISAIQNKYIDQHAISSLTCVGRELYIGTQLGGLKVLQADDNTLTQYRYSQINQKSLPDNFVSSLLCDVQGNVWIGTNEGGLAFVSAIKTHFNTFQLFTTIYDIRDNFVLTLFADSKRNIWAGSSGNGLFCMNSSSSNFEQIKLPELKQSTITAIDEDRNKKIWVATFGNGVFVLNNKNQIEKHIERFAPLGNNLSSNFINDILVTSDNDVWLGTENNGIDVWDNKKSRFYTIGNERNNTLNLTSQQITSLLQDSKGYIWIGTSNGLNCYEKGKGIIKRYFHNKSDSLTLSNDYITALFEDKNKNLWIGTKYGLNKYNDIEGGAFMSFFASDGLADNTIQCIQDDQKGNLWISTNNGVSLFELESWKFYNYNSHDGLQANRFKPAGCKTINGTVLLGGENGITAIYPQKLQHNTRVPLVYINKLEVFNELIKAGDNSHILAQDISLTKSIVLAYNQNVVSFGYTAINYSNPGKTKFAYKLEGVDKEWVITNSKQKFASYAHLLPGKYTFMVKACNSDQVWNTNYTKFEILIIPPFWKTIYFYILVTIVLVGLIISLIRYREYRLKRTRDKFERLVFLRTAELQRKNEQLEVLNKTKDKFFSIIAHDLKNPLNALIGFSELMTSRYDGLDDAQRVRFIGIINNSAKHMYDMLINLLNWSRSQLGAVVPRHAKIKIAVNFEANIALNAQMIENKHLTINTNVSKDCIAWADPTLFDTVIRNLLSNAIKFTPEQGTISLSAQQLNTSMIEVRIADTGVGMTQEILNSLFKIDEYKSQLGTNNEQGTGLGLIVCKEFIEKNGGTLQVESSLNKGSCFSFTIPALILGGEK